MFRQLNTGSVGVNTTEVEEFKIGSHISFNDEVFGKTGTGTIIAFAQADYHPIAWYVDDATGEHSSVHLGWCKLIEQ